MLQDSKGNVFSSLEDEAARLARLKQLQIVDTEHEEAFDRITSVVGRVFDAPICLISFITEDRQWFKACFGLPADSEESRSTPRHVSFCQYVVATKDMVVATDARKHPWFADNLLIQQYGVQFYAGAPIVLEDGFILGTLCILDLKPREFGEEDRRLLHHFTYWVRSELEHRKRSLESGSQLRGKKINGPDAARVAGEVTYITSKRFGLSQAEAQHLQQAVQGLCYTLWSEYGKSFMLYWQTLNDSYQFSVHYEAPNLFLAEKLASSHGLSQLKALMDEIVTSDTAKRYELRFIKHKP